jgi:membrane protease YdiL (CAAX protease family)
VSGPFEGLVSAVWSAEEGRPRAYFRILGALVLYVALTPAIAAPVAILVLNALGERWAGGALSLGSGSLEIRIAVAVGSLVATVLVIWIAGSLIDRRTLSGFGLRVGRAWMLEALLGLVLGAALMGGIFAFNVAVGWSTIRGTLEGWGSLLGIAGPIVVFACAGLSEELVYRGYLLKNFAEGLAFLGERRAVVLALLLSSLVFGLRHASNPNADPLAVANICLAGVMLGLPYVVTGRLGASVGLHVGWNLTQANVFGFPVSGLSSTGAMVFSVKQGGPDLLTGGVFGPEGGLVGTAAIALGCATVLLYGRLAGPEWVRRELALPPTRPQGCRAKPPGAAP